MEVQEEIGHEHLDAHVLQLAQRRQLLAQAIQVLLLAQVDRQDRQRDRFRARRGRAQHAAQEPGPTLGSADLAHLEHRRQHLLAQARRLRLGLAAAEQHHGPGRDRALVGDVAEPAQDRLRRRRLRQRRPDEREIGADRVGRVVPRLVLEDRTLVLALDHVLQSRPHRALQALRGALHLERNVRQHLLVVELELPPVQEAEDERRQHDQHAVQDERRALRAQEARPDLAAAHATSNATFSVN